MTDPRTSTPIENAAQRVIARCAALATHTETPGRITRRYLSEPVHAAHHDLNGWMTAAKMRVRMDAAGNLIGRRPPGSPPGSSPGSGSKKNEPNADPPVLLIGSHIDTVPNAGRYDGVLGVLVGLAVAEALHERNIALPFALDVVAFSEEEGVRFATPYLGSAALAGTYPASWLDLTDDDGHTVRDAIQNFGLDPGAIDDAAYDPQRVLGFLEVHLEQGPVLEQGDQPVGVVNAIAGQSRLRLRLVGEAGHAGTTPMTPRRDALACAARLIAEVQDHGRSIEGLRATVGFLDVQPNVRNVIPGQAELSLDIRHASDNARDASVKTLLDTATRLAQQDGIDLEVVDHQTQPATPMDPSLTGMLTDAMEDAGLPPVALLSGAGHDAVAMAEAFPVAMLFVRHPGGISHHPDEHVEAADVAVAIDVMTRAVLRLAEQLQGANGP